MTFIRFTVPSDEVRIDTHVAAGLFHATYRLAREGRFEEGERLWFEEEMASFNQFLPATRALPTWRAVCWFRGDAGEAISRIWRLVDIVEGEGVPVRVFRTRRPGQIIYADPFQVAAVPWRDSFTPRPHARQTSNNPRRPRHRCGGSCRRTRRRAFQRPGCGNWTDASHGHRGYVATTPPSTVTVAVPPSSIATVPPLGTW